MDEIENYPLNLKKRIQKAGGLDAYKEQLRQQGSVGGRKSTYKRTPEQRKAHSERMKAIWAEKRTQTT